MMVTKIIKNKRKWERFVLANSTKTFLQSWNWGEVNKILGHKIFRFGFFEERKLKGVSLLIKKKAKRGTYLECPGGPLIDWNRPLFFSEFIEQTKKIAKREGCFFVRVRPQLEDALTHRILFKKQGFISAPMHLHAETTWQIDISQSEDQLLRGMRKNTRYLVRKSMKMGLKIEQSIDVADVELLYKLQLEAVARHHFIPFPKRYFLAELNAFAPDKKIKIFKVIYKKKVLVVAFIIFYGKEATYHYSASSSSFPQIPASYALQWQVIKEAKKYGCKIYNLWGIAADDNPKHRFAGVTLFKKGFGGFRVNYLHAQDLPLSLSYWGIYVFERIRKFYRHL